jgi:hypothetical protein
MTSLYIRNWNIHSREVEGSAADYSEENREAVGSSTVYRFGTNRTFARVCPTIWIVPVPTPSRPITTVVISTVAGFQCAGACYSLDSRVDQSVQAHGQLKNTTCRCVRSWLLRIDGARVPALQTKISSAVVSPRSSTLDRRAPVRCHRLKDWRRQFSTGQTNGHALEEERLLVSLGRQLQRCS